jgi:hypothetical protein
MAKYVIHLIHFSRQFQYHANSEDSSLSRGGGQIDLE